MFENMEPIPIVPKILIFTEENKNMNLKVTPKPNRFFLRQSFRS